MLRPQMYDFSGYYADDHIFSRTLLIFFLFIVILFFISNDFHIEIDDFIYIKKHVVMNILILHVEIMPYNIPVFNELVKKGYCLKVIQIDKKKLTPYTYTDANNQIEIVNLSTFQDFKRFSDYCFSCRPRLVLVSEVMERWYWRITYILRKRYKSLPIVLGSDAQWTGTCNNWLKKIFFRISYQKCFTHVISAGLWQCMYALKIGFRREQIITPICCADNRLYHKVDIEIKKTSYPKRFVYVGRLVDVKGIKILIQAWNTIRDKKNWKLTFIGNGELESLIRQYPEIDLHPFMPQDEICKIMQDSGCAIIPSLYEPWGLVIHEAAAAGLPIIVTKRCGAVSAFVRNNYNGFLIDEGCVTSLREAMINIINADKESLIEMSERSRRLSYKIIPEDVSSALLSLI